jgi:hypothetical protein
MHHVLTIDGPPGCSKWKYAEGLACRLNAPTITPPYRSALFRKDRRDCLASDWDWDCVREWLRNGLYERSRGSVLPKDCLVSIAVEDEETAMIWASASMMVCKVNYVVGEFTPREARMLTREMSAERLFLNEEAIKLRKYSKPENDVMIHRLHLDPGLQAVEEKIRQWERPPLATRGMYPETRRHIASRLHQEYTGPNYNVVKLLDGDGCKKPFEDVIAEMLDAYERSAWTRLVTIMEEMEEETLSELHAAETTRCCLPEPQRSRRGWTSGRASPSPSRSPAAPLLSCLLDCNFASQEDISDSSAHARGKWFEEDSP